jgi:hypothetical protein
MAMTHLPNDFKGFLKLLNVQRVVDVLDGVKVNLISLNHLKLNKKAAGRHQDLADLENLP